MIEKGTEGKSSPVSEAGEPIMRNPDSTQRRAQAAEHKVGRRNQILTTCSALCLYYQWENPRCNPWLVVPTSFPEQILNYFFIIHRLPNQKHGSKTTKGYRNVILTHITMHRAPAMQDKAMPACEGTFWPWSCRSQNSD